MSELHDQDETSSTERLGGADSAVALNGRRSTDVALPDGRREYLDQVCDAAREAADEMRSFDQAKVDRIVWRMTRAGLLAASNLARLAVEETSIGVFEDKVFKNYVATEFLYDYLRDHPTVGVIREDPARNLKWVAEPIGTVLAIMPLTNPTSTALFKTIVAAKTRNAMIVRPSSKAIHCSAEAVRVVVEAGIEAGLPEAAIQCLTAPTHPDTQYLFRHPKVDFIWTTGGQRIVQAANASGKPTIGVGPGNAPAYLHASCDIEMAVVDIMLSKTFDASVICPAEQTIVIDDAIWDTVLARMEAHGTRLLDADEAARLTAVCFDGSHGRPNLLAVGRSVAELAGAAGIKVEPYHKVFAAPLERFDESELLLHEKLFPVLALLRAPDVASALEMCDGVTRIAGLGHTSAVYSRDDDVVRRFSDVMRTGRILVNCPTAVGALGGMYTDLPPTYSLGCGTWGGSNTTDNVNVDNLLNIKQVASRRNPPMWFRAPVDIYFNEHAIDNLRPLRARRAAIITSPGNVRRGTIELLNGRLDGVATIDTFSDLPVEPDAADIERGVRFLHDLKPDLLIACGGGSVIDAAKIMRLRYEHPDIDLQDLALPFLDVRKRVAEYPQRRADGLRLVAIPTTSGTGSEVSPVAVMTDATSGRKVTLVDYSLVPEIAIVDPTLVMSMSPELTADTGVDAMTHAAESLVSVFASPYTQALSMQAFYELYRWLPVAYREPENIEARGHVHNASTIAGLAFSNAFVGVCHSLAHALGAVFGVPHGRACGIFLPHVIRYNSGRPTKTTPSPTATSYVAPLEYGRAAIALGLGGSRDDMEGARDAFLRVTCETLDAVDIPDSIADLGIEVDEYRARIPELVTIAFEDLSGRTNPRQPLLVELEQLCDQAWAGRRQMLAAAAELT